MPEVVHVVLEACYLELSMIFGKNMSLALLAVYQQRTRLLLNAVGIKSRLQEKCCLEEDE